MLSAQHARSHSRSPSRPSTPRRPTMRTIRWEGKPFNVTITSLPIPVVNTSEDVIVRLTSSAICGSDLHVYHGIAGSREPSYTLGHEGVGIVQEVGEAVQLVKPGDRVIVSAVHDDGVFAKELPNFKVYGYGPDLDGSTDGMQAEYIRVPQADVSLIPIPHYPSHELDYLMISDIWPTAWFSLDASGFQPGETVAVFGVGPVGLLTVYTALLRGASRVYAIDHVQSRLEKAKELGAIPINFTKGNAAKQILKNEKLGVDRSCDCCGYEAVNDRLEPQQNAIINDMVDVTRPGGGLGVVGIYMAENKAAGRPLADQMSPTIEFPMSAFWVKNLSMKAIIAHPQAVAPQLVELVKSGRAHPGRIVSSIIGIEEVPEGYKSFSKQLETKIVIRFPWQEDDWHVGRNGHTSGYEQNGGWHGEEEAEEEL